METLREYLVRQFPEEATNLTDDEESVTELVKELLDRLYRWDN